MVTDATDPEQTFVLAEMVAVGSGVTVMVMVPVCGCVQAGVSPDVALTNV